MTIPPPGLITDQWVVVTIAINGVVHAWGPFATPHHARRRVAEFRNDEHEMGRDPIEVRYVVCKILDPANEPTPKFD